MFTKKLLPIVDEKKLIGLKITTVGFLSVIIGLIVFLFISPLIGNILIYLGFAGGFVGMITHLW